MSTPFRGTEPIPELPTYVFARPPLLFHSDSVEPQGSAKPSDVKPGSIISVGIGLFDLGVDDTTNRHLLRAYGNFGLGFYEFDVPQPTWLPVVVENVRPSEKKLTGLVIEQQHSVNRQGRFFDFEGYRLSAGFDDLGMTPFRDGMWASDVMTVLRDDESPELYPLPAILKPDLRKLLAGMQEYDRRSYTLSLSRLEAELRFDEPPVVTVDQIRGLTEQRFLQD